MPNLDDGDGRETVQMALIRPISSEEESVWSQSDRLAALAEDNYPANSSLNLGAKLESKGIVLVVAHQN